MAVVALIAAPEADDAAVVAAAAADVAVAVAVVVAGHSRWHKSEVVVEAVAHSVQKLDSQAEQRVHMAVGASKVAAAAGLETEEVVAGGSQQVYVAAPVPSELASR